MKCKFRTAGFWLALVTLCLFSAQGLRAQSASAPAPASGGINQPGLIAANAGCGFSTEDAPVAPVPSQKGSRPFDGASRQPSLVLISAHNDPSSNGGSDGSGIVGLWKVKFVSPNTPGTNDGHVTVVDQGYATWHSDGTEIMNSGRPPVTGNFCMGVWETTRRGTIKLNHWALGWDPGSNFIGPANIKEEVVLDKSETHYFGTFTIDQYESTGKTVLVHIAGSVTAERITVD